MSMSFDKPISDDDKDFIKKMFGKGVDAMDEKIVLLNHRMHLHSEMKEVANQTKQPVSLEINSEGEIKPLSDGSRYRVTESGWKKL